jgi:hypothetical protein
VRTLLSEESGRPAALNLSCHFATTRHSIVRLRAGVEEAAEPFEIYPNRDLVDTLIAWRPGAEFGHEPSGFKTIFARGCLRIMQKQKSLR